ncbi:MAG: cytochrome c-type bioproteinis protein CcmF [Bacillota bacterium]|nr:MAG: cytochrome c-type bioproteinis protein CcmF [Bacillota bacterium]
MGLLILPLLLLLSLTARKEDLGKKYYALYSLGMLGLMSYMVWAFLAEKYSLTWVSKYSDASLPTPLRVAAIWAGQEGTLLLWLLALVAITWTYPWGRVSKVLLGEQLLLLLGFLLLNPLAQSGIDGGLGLNPLLRTSWMLYHPPVVFMGYALLTVPFAEGLLGEVGRGKGYLRLGWLMLGTGLTLGGFWAYRVLGWGGFWAWDPVEAASLVPWLLATVALHLYHRDQARPFTVLAYVAVIWAVAITRSGILATTSVHAFAGSSTAPYLYLLLVIHVGVSLYVLFKNRKQQDPLPLVWQAVALYALWVAAGTALPLISSLVLSDVMSIGPGFYRSGAIPTVLLTAWALRHSLQRDGTARSLTHFGVILFLIGAVASSQYSSSQTLSLESGDMQEVGELGITYTRTPSGGAITAVFRADTIQTRVELRQAELVKPVIWRQLWQDIYISPLSVGDRGGEIVTLKSGEVLERYGERIELLGLIEGMRLEGHTLVAEVLYGEELVVPALVVTEGGIRGRKALLPTGGAVALVGVDNMGTEVTLQLYSPQEAESLLVAEVSVKPLMNFVRFGVILTLLGGLATLIESVLSKHD